jgi:hypothetical protein
MIVDANDQFAKVTDIIAPTAQDIQCRGLLEKNGKVTRLFQNIK